MFHECHLWSIDCSEKSAPPYSASDKCAAAPPRKQISSLQPVSQWGYTCMDIRDISWHSWYCIYWNLLRLDLFFFDLGKTMACPLWSSSAATTWVAIHSKQRMPLILHKLTSLKRMKRQWLFHLDLFFTACNFVVFNFWNSESRLPWPRLSYFYIFSTFPRSWQPSFHQKALWSHWPCCQCGRLLRQGRAQNDHMAMPSCSAQSSCPRPYGQVQKCCCWILHCAVPKVVQVEVCGKKAVEIEGNLV